MESYSTISFIAQQWAETHREPNDRTNDRRPECRLSTSEDKPADGLRTRPGRCLAYILMYVLGSSSSEWHGQRPSLPSQLRISVGSAKFNTSFFPLPHLLQHFTKPTMQHLTPLSSRRTSLFEQVLQISSSS